MHDLVSAQPAHPFPRVRASSTQVPQYCSSLWETKGILRLDNLGSNYPRVKAEANTSTICLEQPLNCSIIETNSGSSATY